MKSYEWPKKLLKPITHDEIVDECTANANIYHEGSIKNIIWSEVIQDTVVDFSEIDRWIVII
jgi:hypothetical protein